MLRNLNEIVSSRIRLQEWETPHKKFFQRMWRRDVRTEADFMKYNFVEVSGHNLESSQT
jgi:hypothetical protein